MEIVHDNYIFLTISISMPSFDYFTEETETYNFLKNHLYGNILDVTNGTFFSYTSSKLLFENNNINDQPIIPSPVPQAPRLEPVSAPQGLVDELDDFTL